MTTPFRLFFFLLLPFLGCGVFAQTAVMLTATADGTAPFTYLWTKDGSALLSASTGSIAATSSGAYGVTVANAAGTATSAPANLIITAGAAVDLSKQFAECAQSGAWAPAVGQFPQFAVIPFVKVTDPGAHFSDATGFYTIGAGEAGYYQIILIARTADNPTPNTSLGLTAGKDNLDTKTLWTMTPAAGLGYVHFGAQVIISGSYAAGDQIRGNVFVSQPLTFQGFSMIIRRLY